MARGFESKDVEFQQSEAGSRRTLRPAVTPEERERQEALRGVELALSRARADLARATNAVHRGMLEQFIHELEARLR